MGNNVEQFNRAPSAGGMKVTQSADVRLTASRFAGTSATASGAT